MTPVTVHLHPVAWVVWLISAMIIVLITSNPLYHAAVAVCALVVYANVRPGGRNALDAFLLLGWTCAFLSTPLNLVTGSSGANELVTLPSLTLPGWLGSVTLGGLVTAESLLYALDQTLSLAAIISIVCAFNAGVDHFQLLKLTPPGLAQLGIVVSVSLLLVPETLARTRALREARVARGYADRLSPVMVFPLLSDALERAVQRAESLDARGFGTLVVPPSANDSLMAIAGLVLATCGAFSWYYASDERYWAAVALVGGSVLVAWTAWRQASRGVARRVFVLPILRSDALIGGAAIFSLSAVFTMQVLSIGDVTYLPFPVLTAPTFHLGVATAIALLAAPALMRGAR